MKVIIATFDLFISTIQKKQKLIFDDNSFHVKAITHLVKTREDMMVVRIPLSSLHAMSKLVLT
jgi:hypothetical protein